MAEPAKKSGLRFERVFHKSLLHPFNDVVWEKRKSSIKEADGSSVFEADDVEVPAGWSQLATDILASKYLRKAGVPSSNGRETSAKQVIGRVAGAIRDFGERNGYFAAPVDALAFHDDLIYLLTHQFGAFNSPVFFNCGLSEAYGIKGNSAGTYHWDEKQNKPVLSETAYDNPAVSACFIQGIRDDLMDIAEHAKREMRVFKHGGGSGCNYSNLRGEGEPLSGGGTSSGVMSFLNIFDAAAGATKSGGVTRRAARMVVLNADHPDIEKFVSWKGREEDKAHALIREGYPSDFNSETYQTIGGQNANNSVGVEDNFMEAVEKDGEWTLKWRTNGKACKTLRARALWRQMAEAAHRCADPGIQFLSTINKWHTVPKAGPITSPNPCCFVSSCLVDTSEGMIEIGKLEEMSSRGEKLPYAFSHDVDDTDLPVLRQIKKAWVAGETKWLAEVKTDRGIVIRCTPEHRFLLRSGEYVEAQFLKPGTRLRKIGRAINKNRSQRRQLHHRPTADVPNSTVWMNRFMWEQVNGKIPDGYHVHHKNDDPTDDRLSNFELVERIEHITEHSAADNNPRFIEADENLLVETWEAVEKLPRTTFKPADKPVTMARWNKFIYKNGLVGKVPLANSGRKCIRGMAWDDFEDWIEERRGVVNDRVLEVNRVKLDAPVKVYDLEVEEVHNFAVSSPGVVHSVVVHNSEFLHHDNTACNLASLNLMKFVKADGNFDVEKFKHAVRIFIVAQDILVDYASYPTEAICQNSHDYRPLGLGYANLGTLLMTRGIPYDSDEGRELAATITAIMTGHAYATSSEIAQSKGAFNGFASNREEMRKVISKHHGHVYGGKINLATDMGSAAVCAWDDALEGGEEHGFRNSQVTLLAPTGTIGLLMDCDTTGVEPEFALVKTKKLAGGGFLTIVNKSVEPALTALGYSPDERAAILKNIEANGDIAGCSGLKPEHLPVFDTAVGKRSIKSMGHILMMAAVQPFLSGAISKTVNLPAETTVEQIEEIHMQAWKLGLKSIAIYRDGSKHSQVLETKKDAKLPGGDKTPIGQIPLGALKDELVKAVKDNPPAPKRKRLDKRRKGGFTQEARVGGSKVFVRTGEYEDGTPGEVFIDVDGYGGTLQGLIQALAKSISVSLQHGVPLEAIVKSLETGSFDPRGPVSGVPGIKSATSLVNYVMRLLEAEYLKKEAIQAEVESPPFKPEALAEFKERGFERVNRNAAIDPSAPLCSKCGHLTIRNGSCHRCINCGESMGCS